MIDIVIDYQEPVVGFSVVFRGAVVVFLHLECHSGRP